MKKPVISPVVSDSGKRRLRHQVAAAAQKPARALLYSLLHFCGNASVYDSRRIRELEEDGAPVMHLLLVQSFTRSHHGQVFISSAAINYPG